MLKPPEIDAKRVFAAQMGLIYKIVINSLKFSKLKYRSLPVIVCKLRAANVAKMLLFVS
jgi:uncharacterized protein with PQ loop repeat